MKKKNTSSSKLFKSIRIGCNQIHFEFSRKNEKNEKLK